MRSAEEPRSTAKDTETEPGSSGSPASGGGLDRERVWTILRAQLGDRKALEELLSWTEGWVRRYCLRLTGNLDSANDVVQETLISTYRSLGLLQEPTVYRSWVYRIATRHAYRSLRKRSRRRRHEVEVEVLPDAESEGLHANARLESSELDSALRLQVHRLPAKSRVVVVLHYFEQIPLREIATVLDVPEGTVKSRLAYGLTKLRRRVSSSSAT